MQLPSSFRDPSGFLFTRAGVLLRQVNHSYQETFEKLEGSGLAQELIDAGLLVAHQRSDEAPLRPELGSLVLQPEHLPFISYPYEWSFSQLQDAALLTLDVAQRALAHDMSLKDASAYNVQFHGSHPVFIDTLSFEEYEEGKPWVAYKQFCQHFLAPLALMSRADVSLNQLLRTNIDGVPLPLASRLLPWQTRLHFGLLTHIHLHAKVQNRYADEGGKAQARSVSRHRLQALLDNLQSVVRGLRWQPAGTEWGDYYADTNYTDDAMTHKQELVQSYLQESAPRSVWDLGANTGAFSRLAAAMGAQTMSFDIDPAAVEKNYRQGRDEDNRTLLPLLLDLANPSPSIGWHHQERDALLDRGPADTAMALALIHHLCISNNLPFAHVAAFLQASCTWLIIEFVPKADSQVKRLLSSREDVFPDYDKEHFEAAFQECFDMVRSTPVRGTERTLYLMRARSAGEVQ